MKISKIFDFRKWLIDNDLRWEESDLGHVKILDPSTGRLLYQVWLDTEKWMSQETQTRHVGLEAFKQTWYNRSFEKSTIRQDWDGYAPYIGQAQVLIIVTQIPDKTLETTIYSKELKNAYQLISEQYDENMQLYSCPARQIVDFIIR